MCAGGTLTGTEGFKRVSNSEGNRAAIVWSSLPLKVEKWKHISPLTAAVDLTPPRRAAYDVVRRRGGPRGCPRGSLFLVRD